MFCYINPHSLLKSSNLPLKVKAYVEYLVSSLNLNAFLQKIETAIQGTPAGVFVPPEDKVQVHSNLLRIFQALCAGSISLTMNETYP